jgi:hypothetical protein
LCFDREVPLIAEPPEILDPAQQIKEVWFNWPSLLLRARASIVFARKWPELVPIRQRVF